MCYPNNTVEYRNAMDTENETISQYNREVNQIHFYIWVLSTSALYITGFLCYYSIKLTKKVSSINQVRFISTYINAIQIRTKKKSQQSNRMMPVSKTSETVLLSTESNCMEEYFWTFFLLIKQVIEFIGICTSELRLLRNKTIVVDNDWPLILLNNLFVLLITSISL